MRIDERSKQWGVQVIESPNALWMVDAVECVVGHTSNVYYVVNDANGKGQADISCVFGWPERDLTARTDGNGQTNFTMGPAGAIHIDPATGRGHDGPYEAYVGKRSESDVVTGMGIPVGLLYVEYRLTFKPRQPMPSLQQVAIAQAQQRMIPVHNDAWLQKQARAKDLGHPETGEFEFNYDSQVYIGQVFERGLAIVEKGRYDSDIYTKVFPYPRS